MFKVVAGVLGQKWGLFEMMDAIDNMIAEYWSEQILSTKRNWL